MRKTLEIAAICAAVGLGFLLVNFLHFQFVPVSVILWACLVDLLITLIILVPAGHFLLGRRSRLTPEESVLSVLLASVTVILYAVMGPTVIDRSLSIYIVQKLDQRGGAIAIDAVPDIFVEEYMPEFRLVDVRLTEQISSGTARVEGNCLVLTSKGRLLADFAEIYRRTLLPQKRVLMGEVTDQLTRPFDGAQQKVDIACDRSAQSDNDVLNVQDQ